MSAGGTRVTRRSLADVEVLELEGEVDLVSAELVREAISETTAPTVVLDLCAVEFVDSAGLRAFDAANRKLSAEGRALAFVAPPGSRAAFTFRVAGFSRRAVHESVDAVVRTVARH